MPPVRRSSSPSQPPSSSRDGARASPRALPGRQPSRSPERGEGASDEPLQQLARRRRTQVAQATDQGAAETSGSTWQAVNMPLRDTPRIPLPSQGGVLPPPSRPGSVEAATESVPESQAPAQAISEADRQMKALLDGNATRLRTLNSVIQFVALTQVLPASLREDCLRRAITSVDRRLAGRLSDADRAGVRDMRQQLVNALPGGQAPATVTTTAAMATAALPAATRAAATPTPDSDPPRKRIRFDVGGASSSSVPPDGGPARPATGLRGRLGRGLRSALSAFRTRPPAEREPTPGPSRAEVPSSLSAGVEAMDLTRPVGLAPPEEQAAVVPELPDVHGIRDLAPPARLQRLQALAVGIERRFVPRPVSSSAEAMAQAVLDLAGQVQHFRDPGSRSAAWAVVNRLARRVPALAGEAQVQFDAECARLSRLLSVDQLLLDQQRDRDLAALPALLDQRREHEQAARQAMPPPARPAAPARPASATPQGRAGASPGPREPTPLSPHLHEMALAEQHRLRRSPVHTPLRPLPAGADLAPMAQGTDAEKWDCFRSLADRISALAPAYATPFLAERPWAAVIALVEQVRHLQSGQARRAAWGLTDRLVRQLPLCEGAVQEAFDGEYARLRRLLSPAAAPARPPVPHAASGAVGPSQVTQARPQEAAAARSIGTGEPGPAVP